MNISLYCSPTQLLMLVGSVNGQEATVEEFKAIPWPTHLMTNGVITDRDAMAGFLQDISQRLGPWKQDAVLILEGANIRSRVMTLPAVRENRLLPFVQRDFDEISEEAGDVFDFTVLGRKGTEDGLEVLGVAINRALLQNYRDVFMAADFRLRRIDVGSNTLAKLTGFIPQLRSGNSILVQVDGAELAVTFFEQGMYRFTQRYRLSHAAVSVERDQEVIDHISSVVQFQKSLNRDIAITVIHVLGITSERLPTFIEQADCLAIPVAGLFLDEQIKLTGKAHFEQAGFVSSKYLHNIGAMIRR
jgi:hypothetical protein